MEPPPLPTQSGRFRLRVQILPPLDAYNLNAVPLRQFTIVKTSALALPDLSLQQLCDEVVKRFRAIYPGESLFAIEKPQDSYGSDLYLGDRVRDIFEDNEIFRVIKGATIRASVEPHRARSQSVQPPSFFPYGSTANGKRNHGLLDPEDSHRGHKRQRIISADPDHPIRSSERDTADREVQPQEETILVKNSQEITAPNNTGRGINAASQRSPKYRPSTSGQALDDVSADLQFPNGTTKNTAPLERDPSLENNFKEVAASSSSDSEPPRQNYTSRTKRKLIPTGDFSEQDRGQSTSTAITTPLSAVQQTSHQSPVDGSRKLRRPSNRPARNNSENQQEKILPPRKNIYEDIETDSEHHSVKPLSHDVSSTLINSYKWRNSTLASKQSSDKSSSPLRKDSSTKDKHTRTSMGRELDHEQTLEREQPRTAKLAKRRSGEERSRLTFESEQQRLEGEDRNNGLLTRQESGRVTAELSRQALEAQGSTEVEARRQKNVSAKSTMAKAAQQPETHALDERTTARQLEERAIRLNQIKEASEVDSTGARLEADVVQKATGGNDSKKQHSLQSKPEIKSNLPNLQALQATVRRAANGPEKVLTASADGPIVQIEPQTRVPTSQSISNSTMTMNTQATCTPFIPRGRPLRPSQMTLPPTKAAEGSLATTLSPNVGLEDQMPMPSQLKRKVSFLDQAPPSARRSSSASSTLKQTTLVPPRLGITDVKITPKRTVFMGKSNELKSSKGKAKVVESPAKPPTPIIEISSGEESIQKSNKIRAQHERFRGVSSAGPAYTGNSAINSSSPPKSQTIEDVKQVDSTVQDRPNPNGRVKQTALRSSITSPKGSISSIDPNSQRERALLSREGPSSHVLSNSSRTTHPKINTYKFQRNSSARLYDFPKETEILGQDESLETFSDRVQNSDGNTLNGELNQESEPAEAPDNPTPDVSESASEGDNCSSHHEEDHGLLPNNEGDKESAHNGKRGESPPVNVIVPSKNGQEERPRLNFNVKDAKHDSADEELDTDDTDSEYDRADGEFEEYSDIMQAQIDDQLLSQSFEASSSLEQKSTFRKRPERSPSTLTGNGLYQNQTGGRPSLKRMNQEAQRDKLTRMKSDTQFTQKPNAMKTAELRDEEDETSLSELDSSSSDYEGDEEKSGINQHMKGRDLMFRPTSNHQQQGATIEEKKSKRIGWAKLGKQFSVNRH